MSRVNIWLPSALICLSVFIRTTLFQHIQIAGASPDLALILLVFFANRQGSLRTEIAGFISGLVEDFLSLSPLGFNAFIKTLIGYIFGITRGKILIDAVLMPAVLLTIATLLKSLGGIILILLFLNPELLKNIFSVKVLVEIAMNALLSPFIFAVFKILRAFNVIEKDEY
ncbi:MAG: rod shape-determining protein MreD [Spirochaetota bacterium]